MLGKQCRGWTRGIFIQRIVKLWLSDRQFMEFSLKVRNRNFFRNKLIYFSVISIKSLETFSISPCEWLKVIGCLIKTITINADAEKHCKRIFYGQWECIECSLWFFYLLALPICFARRLSMRIFSFKSVAERGNRGKFHFSARAPNTHVRHVQYASRCAAKSICRRHRLVSEWMRVCNMFMDFVCKKGALDLVVLRRFSV